MAGRKKSTAPKETKRTPTKIKFVPLENDNGKTTEPYVILNKLLKAESLFSDIRLCNILLLWRTEEIKRDADGIATTATVRKASEIDRLLVERIQGKKAERPDIFIELPERYFNKLTDIQKEHLIYHELCHVHPAKDAKGEQKYDTKDRPIWRIGRHPITIFTQELAKYGDEACLGFSVAMGEVVDQVNDKERPSLPFGKTGNVDPATGEVR